MARGRGWSTPETLHMLGLVEQILPFGSNLWKTVQLQDEATGEPSIVEPLPRRLKRVVLITSMWTYRLYQLWKLNLRRRLIPVLRPRVEGIREKDLVEALKVVVIQRQWDVAKLLCEKLQKKEYEDALQLVDKDDGRMLLDRLYHECSRDTVLEATELAISRGKHEILHLLENNYSIINMTLPFNQLSLGGDNVRVTSDAKPEHQTIRCFIPDLYPFEIDLSSVNTVSDLKSQLHAERPDCFGDVSAESIWLYLAKRGDEWLSEKSEALAMGDSWPVRDLLIEDLKKLIKAEMADFTRVDASEIQLNVARERKVAASFVGRSQGLDGGRNLSFFGARGKTALVDGNPFADVFAIYVIAQSPGMNLGVFRNVPSSTRFRWDDHNARLHDMQ
ncbi:hypothetical protein PC118_g19987 [Phytophthora cactorum]|uniref:Crinkler effector protein N-terminal domain-containing protein n=1 Tax=Phytophthora cactorum TaxID=29920 RepID=A0A8T1EZT5_9STRA|nr:hypothetical protein PC118_g19987 [Phytophthora cactorum]